MNTLVLCVFFLQVVIYGCMAGGKLRDFVDANGENLKIRRNEVYKRKCFPSHATVNLENGQTVTMSKLSIGDRVQTVSSNGKTGFSEVRTFFRQQPEMVELYRTIKTESHSLDLSEKHLIYARKAGSTAFNTVYANEVAVGDDVLVQGNEAMVPSKVQEISTAIKKGMYAPLTMEGNIVVDGVLASCYASYDHDVAHFALQPVLWFPGVIDAFFNADKGTPAYINVVEELTSLYVEILKNSV